MKKSVEVNPEAHFGRERWQVVLAEFMLIAMSDPKQLRTFDFLGNRLDLNIDEILNRESNWMQTGYGRSTSPDFSRGYVTHEVPAFFRPDVQSDDPERWAELNPIRKHITKIGAEREWENVLVISHREPVPFDEPVLGIIGMWRQGGGASPHFTLALGEVMLRVGQRHLAWAAFERASTLSERFWPDPAMQEFLRQHCRTRQKDIEQSLTSATRRSSEQPGPPLSPEEVTTLRPRFEAELAHGEGYQRAYQEYEEKQLAAGVPLTDEHFFDSFNASHEPIVSPVGAEEWFASVPRSKMYDYAAERRLAWGAFCAGVGGSPWSPCYSDYVQEQPC